MHDLQELKKRHKHLYRLTFQGQDYIYRALSMGEFRKVSLVEIPAEKEWAIIRTGVVLPDLLVFEEMPSGLAEALVIAISRVTDITEDRLLTEIGKARDRLGITDDILTCKIQIIKHLNYTPEQVDAMDVETFMDSVALAEAILGQPLLAAGKDDGTTAQPSIPSGDGIVDVPDMKNLQHMEEVADRNAEELRRVWRSRKSHVR